jgi:hypothetical protein
MNKEPIEMLTEMHQMILDMKNQMHLMDNNIKLMQAKLNADVLSSFSKQMYARQVHEEKPVEAKTAPSQITIPAPKEPVSKSGTMVQGKVLSEDGKPMHGIAIKIMNSDKKVIKETVTNRAGVWMAQLRPGKYISKVILDNKPAQFKLFDVIEGQSQQEV